VRKKRQVVISEDAKRDVQGIRDYIARDRTGAAAKWLQEFQRQARSLATFPLRFEVIPEAEEVGASFRHVVFGSYRIIYHVTENQVAVLRVVHGARLLTRAMLNPDPPPAD
jgi:addiction module RelE/StbE family toxin